MRIRGEDVTRWCVLLFGAMLCVTSASGQIDDGFDIGCCATPLPNIHQIAWPEIVDQPAAYAGIANCAPFNQTSPVVKLYSPTFPYCDYGVADVKVAFPAPGFETIVGTLYMKYARTWMDGYPTPNTQVWRFLVNGDLVCEGPATTGCASVLPPCWQGSPLGLGVVHWDGHVDYAYNGEWSVSLSLNHLPGLYSHDYWSCAFVGPPYDHIYESYHVVFPGSFVFGNLPPPTGTFVADAVRRSILATPSYSCMSEIHLEPIGGLATNLPTLSCPLPISSCAQCPFFAQCWNEQSLNALSCSVMGTSMSIFSAYFPAAPGSPPNPLPPNTGFASYTIGRWPFAPAPTVYPWSATLTLYLGTIVASPDPCGAPMNWAHVVTGVSTWGEPPFQARLFNSGNCTCGNTLISHACIDLANVLLLGNGFLPGYGCAAASDLVLNLNLP